MSMKERRENKKTPMKHQSNHANESSMKEGEKMKIRKHLWITVLALGLTVLLLVACGAKETPAPAPTEAPAATEPPAATETPAATDIGNGNKDFKYHSCKLKQATQAAFGGLSEVPGTWSESF